MLRLGWEGLHGQRKAFELTQGIRKKNTGMTGRRAMGKKECVGPRVNGLAVDSA